MNKIRTLNRVGSCNCYLIDVNDGFILIDTGGSTIFNTNKSVSRNRLDKELEKAGCYPGTLKIVILTHGHTDHIGNAAYIREKYKTEIAIHKSDLEYTATKPVIPIKTYKTLSGRLLLLFFKSSWEKMNSEFEVFTPDSVIDENFDLFQYGFDAKIIHLPGHTKGGIGILTTNNDLFCGDTLVNILKPGILAGTAENMDDWNSSIEKLRNLNIKTVYTAHGRPFPMDRFTKKK